MPASNLHANLWHISLKAPKCGHWSACNDTWALLREKLFSESVQVSKLFMQRFSFSTGLQPDRTIQLIAIVQYIQHCQYPPPHAISSQSSPTQPTCYSGAHTSSHGANALSNATWPLILQTNVSTSPSPVRKLPEWQHTCSNELCHSSAFRSEYSRKYNSICL